MDTIKQGKIKERLKTVFPLLVILFMRLRQYILMPAERKILRWQSHNPGLLMFDEYSMDGVKGYSQSGQDIFCFHNIFKSMNKGIFVEVGAHLPKINNNTYYFEKHGWTGIAFEPQEQISKLWDMERKTKCLPYAIGNENKKVSFVIGESYENLSGVDGFNKVGKNSVKKIVAVQQRRLDEILIENNIKQVDYLSIDVEGYEMHVLLGLNLSKIEVKCIDIENDIGNPHIGKSELRKYILSLGYRQVARIGCDDIFVKNAP